MTESAPTSGSAESPKRFPRWKKVLMGTAALFVLIGFGLQASSLLGGDPETEAVMADAGSSEERSSVDASFIGNSLVPTDPGTSRDREFSNPNDIEMGDAGEYGSGPRIESADESGDWSPAFMKLGFSFFVGLSIGYMLRTFFKISLVFIGLILLSIFGLQYFGLVDVNWEAMEGHFNSLVATLKEEASNFKTFIAGSLPSAGMASLGLFTGFKRR